MAVYIQARGFAMTGSLDRYVRQQVERGLGKRLESISRLRVELSDINGPRGGVDKCCRVHIAVPRQRGVVVTDIQPDMYNAIYSAIYRARLVLARRLSKPRGRARGRAVERHRKYAAPELPERARDGAGDLHEQESQL